MLTFHRYLLLVTGVMLSLIGVAYCVDPNLLLTRYELSATGVSEDNMYRGAYGGLFIALGAAIAAGFFVESFRRSATLIALLFMGGFAFGRLVSIASLGMPHEQIVSLLVFEVVASLLFAWMLISSKLSHPVSQ